MFSTPLPIPNNSENLEVTKTKNPILIPQSLIKKLDFNRKDLDKEYRDEAFRQRKWSWNEKAKNPVFF